MPFVIKSASSMYLEENNNVFNFVNEFICKDEGGYFTLKDAKDYFKGSQHYNGKNATLKAELQKVLNIQCIENKKIKGKNVYSVFMGYIIKSDGGIDY